MKKTIIVGVMIGLLVAGVASAAKGGSLINKVTTPKGEITVYEVKMSSGTCFVSVGDDNRSHQLSCIK